MTILKKNLIFQILYQILAVLLPLVTTPIVARALGVSLLGSYSYTSAIVNYFSLFTLLGVKSYGTREIAKEKAIGNKDTMSEKFCEIYILQIVLGLITTTLYYCFVPMTLHGSENLGVIQGIVLISTILDVSWFYFGIENFRITITRDIAVKIIGAILVVVLVRDQSDLLLYAVIVGGSCLICNGYLVSKLREYVDWVHVKTSSVLKHLLPEIMLFLPVVAASFFVYVDKIMLGIISGETQTGYYECMEKIINVPTAGINALMMVMFPRISILLNVDGDRKVDEYIDMSIFGVGLFSALFTFGIIFVARYFVPIYMGDDFEPAIRTLQFGALIILPRGLRGLIKSEYLLPNGKDKEVTVSIASGAGVNFALNVLLLPRWGANGAVVATVLCEIVSCAVALYYSRNSISIRRMLKILTPTLMCGVFMGCSIALLDLSLSIDYSRVLKMVILIGTGIGTFGIMSSVALLLFKRKIISN